MVGCPDYIKCPTGKYCIAKKFTPIKKDIPQTLSIKEREKSSLEKMKLVNRQRKNLPKGERKPPYKPIYMPKTKRVWNANDFGHIYGYACYDLTDAQKQFKEDNSAYTEAFRVAVNECRSTDSYGNLIPGKEYLRNRKERNKCYSKVIEREIAKNLSPFENGGI